MTIMWAKYWIDNIMFESTAEKANKIKGKLFSRDDPDQPTVIKQYGDFNNINYGDEQYHKLYSHYDRTYFFFHYNRYKVLNHRPDNKPFTVYETMEKHINNYCLYNILYRSYDIILDKDIYYHDYGEYLDFISKDDMNDNSYIMLNVDHKNQLISRCCKHRLNIDISELLSC